VTTRTALGIAASIGFLAAILAANYATTNYGLIPVGFGLVATAGTFFAGATFVLRDSVNDILGRWVVLALIVIGAGLSFAVSAPFIAIASAVAFLVSELVDMLIYGPLRKRGYIRAATASNIAGAFVDTILFLWIAGFPIWTSLPGQMVAKLTVTAVVVLAVWGSRALLREPVRV
jgi:hypothetical protein